MEQYKKIGVALAEERERCGKTQQDVAKHLGVTYQAVSGYERGERKIESAYLLNLLLWFDVDIYDFLDRCGFEVMRKLNSTTPVFEKNLLSYFYSLNDDGQKEACKRIGELANLSQYSKSTSSKSKIS